MIGARIGSWINKVLAVVHGKVLVGLRKSRDILVSSPHITEIKGDNFHEIKSKSNMKIR